MRPRRSAPDHTVADLEETALRTLPRAGAGLLALTLAGSIAACGDDDDSEMSDTTESADTADTTDTTDGDDASGASEDLCGPVVEFNGKVLQVELDETSTEEDITAAGAELAPLAADIAEHAFTNESETEPHEMLLLRKADGVQLSFQEIFDKPEEEAMTVTEFVGATFAMPGDDSLTLGELTPGQYAMVCFVPVGGAEAGPPHLTQGMLQEFTVV